MARMGRPPLTEPVQNLAISFTDSSLADLADIRRTVLENSPAALPSEISRSLLTRRCIHLVARLLRTGKLDASALAENGKRKTSK